MNDVIPVPRSVIDAVEHYVEAALKNAEKYQNREPLDEFSIRDLHTVAAQIYQRGFEDGVVAEGVRGSYQHLRARAANAALATAVNDAADAEEDS